MTTIGSAYRLQRLHRLQTLTIPRQRGSFIMSGKSKNAHERRRISHSPANDPCWPFSDLLVLTKILPFFLSWTYKFIKIYICYNL